MAKFTSRLLGMLLMLFLFGLAACARGRSPLLVEDEGNRRNRPAGEFLEAFLLSQLQNLPISAHILDKKIKL